MTQKQIKSEVKKLRLDIEKNRSIRDSLKEKVRKSESDIADAWETLYRLQNKCKHDFPNEKNPTVMGKGICRNCGVNDY